VESKFSSDARDGHFAVDCSQQNHNRVEAMMLIKANQMKTITRVPYNRMRREPFYAAQEVQYLGAITSEIMRQAKIQFQDMSEGDMQADDLMSTNNLANSSQGQQSAKGYMRARRNSGIHDSCRE
jgi:hypothetical protein